MGGARATIGAAVSLIPPVNSAASVWAGIAAAADGTCSAVVFWPARAMKKAFASSAHPATSLWHCALG